MNRQQRRAARRRGGTTGHPTASTPRHGPGTLQAALQALEHGDAPRAEAAARRALAAGADDDAARVLVTALRLQGRLDEAVLEGRRLVRRSPRHAAGHEALGLVLHQQDRMPEATATFRRAVAIGPDRWVAHVGLGNALAALGHLDEATEHLEHATRLAPDRAAPHSDLARVHFRRGAWADASTAYATAAQHAPASDLVRWNQALAQLGTGDLAAGWDLYEHGFACGARTPARSIPRPRWTGEDLTGRTILLWREQGLGDEVRFATCIPDVVARAGHVVVEATDRLVDLFARSFPQATVRAQSVDASGRERGDVEGVDVQAPLGSLPGLLRRRREDFDAAPGCLVADTDQRARFRDRLAALPAGPRVGICWRSGNLSTERLANYLTLEEWGPALDVEGVTFVNLQYGDVQLREEELDALEATTGVRVHRFDDVDYTNDLDAVAALTAELDAVVGPNSFPVMLAGALAVPTFTPHPPSIWTLGGDTDPWFPRTVHVTRAWDQPWEPAVRRIADELAALRQGVPA